MSAQTTSRSLRGRAENTDRKPAWAARKQDVLMDKPVILILLHQKDQTFDRALIRFMMKEWEAMGCTVDVMRGIKQQPPADLVIPHIDLTVMPQEYVDWLRAYPNVANRQVRDISKSRISEHLVRRHEHYAGPVIVKTDRNYGGIPEWLLSPPSRFRPSRWAWFARRLIGKVLRTDLRRVAWRYVESMPPHTYPVFPSVHDVPSGVFENTNLVVEKFLPEITDGLYSLRYYYFFGSAGVSLVFRSKAKGPIKAENALSVEESPVPQELSGIRERLGFDYGKFDYVLRDGRVVLYDVNRTPATEALLLWGLREQIAGRLAEGIRSMLRPSGLSRPQGGRGAVPT
jgi:hypothetical protein